MGEEFDYNIYYFSFHLIFRWWEEAVIATYIRRFIYGIYL